MRIVSGRVLLRLALLAAVFAVAGCTAKPAVDHRFVQAFSEPYRLDAGDRLRVIVFGQENLTNSYTVDDSGAMAMPLVGSVRARGRTAKQIEGEITSRLAARYLRDPNVSVEVERYRPFFVLGEVNEAGQFAYVSNLTVETAVAVAGGFSPRAKKDFVILTRNIDGVLMSEFVPLNFPILPGDTVEVKERWF
ncbi:polysaccharide biosynthesis/export family protein [Tepidamorphus sp. 3E244]|uniref:polysaccharide biosynthesis/export family protein n=1 Tax=Tepidamorphus sp. 3E244 TaxID=3385498 RepID=UPI0038FBFE71